MPSLDEDAQPTVSAADLVALAFFVGLIATLEYRTWRDRR
jgi:hypothetical protein